MPRVPSEFVPQVPLQDGQMPAYQAPDVAPMRLYAGEQQVEMGTAMRNTGNVVWRVGQIIADEVNEARVKEGIVQLGNGANAILKGENGYFTNEGKAAETQFGTAEMALNEAANGILDGLDNDAQKSVFRQVAAQHLMSWKGSMADHRNREVRKYNINTSLASEAMNADLAGMELGTSGPTRDFEKLQGAAIEDRRHALMLQGIPDGSPIMVDQLRDVRLRIAKSGIRAMMDRNDYQGALNFIEQMTKPLPKALADRLPAHQKVGRLSAEDVGALKSELLARRNPQMERELAFSIKNNGTFETEAGTGRYDMPVDSADADIKVVTREEPDVDAEGKPIIDEGGVVRTRTVPSNEVRYTVLPDTPVHASTDAVVEDVGGDMVTLKTSDGTRIYYKNLTNITVEPGQPIARRTVLGTPKAAEDGKASFTYSLTRDGISIPATSPNMLPINVGKQRAGRPATLTEALDMVDMLPTERRAGTRAALRALYSQDIERIEAERIDAIVDAKTWFAEQVAGKAVGDETRPIIRREQVVEYLTKKGKIGFVSSDDIQAIVNNTGTPGWVLAQYEAGNMTPALLEKYADVVSAEDYAKMRAELNRPEYLDVKIAQDELSDIFVEMGMDAKYVTPEKDSKEEAEVIMIRRNLNEMLRRTQQARGKKLDRDEREKIIKEALGIHVWKSKSWWGGFGMLGEYSYERQRLMSLPFSDVDTQRPLPIVGEDPQVYIKRVQEWEEGLRESVIYRTTVTEGGATQTTRFSKNEMRDAMTELAAAGEPINYETTVLPTASMMSLLYESGVSKQDVRMLMQETAGFMTPDQRLTLVTQILQENAQTTPPTPFDVKQVIMRRAQNVGPTR